MTAHSRLLPQLCAAVILVHAHLPRARAEEAPAPKPLMDAIARNEALVRRSRIDYLDVAWKPQEQRPFTCQHVIARFDGTREKWTRHGGSVESFPPSVVSLCDAVRPSVLEFPGALSERLIQDAAPDVTVYGGARQLSISREPGNRGWYGKLHIQHDVFSRRGGLGGGVFLFREQWLSSIVPQWVSLAECASDDSRHFVLLMQRAKEGEHFARFEIDVRSGCLKQFVWTRVPLDKVEQARAALRDGNGTACMTPTAHETTMLTTTVEGTIQRDGVTLPSVVLSKASWAAGPRRTWLRYSGLDVDANAFDPERPPSEVGTSPVRATDELTGERVRITEHGLVRLRDQEESAPPNDVESAGNSDRTWIWVVGAVALGILALVARRWVSRSRLVG